MDEQEPKPSLYAAWRYAHDERSAFIFVDVFAASAGIWIPLIVGLLHPGSTFLGELIKLFDSAGVYIYAIAFMATSSSFLYLERRKAAVNQAREHYDRNAVWFAVAGIALGMLLVGIQVSSTAPTPEPPSIANLNVIHEGKNLPPGAPSTSNGPLPPAEKINKCVNNNKTSSGLLITVQALYLMAALWFGYRLFCLKNIQKIPGELERIQTAQAEQRKKLLDDAQHGGSFD